ncbi:MAG: DUF885 family protein, partial [Acidobacteriaceae bacterium]
MTRRALLALLLLAVTVVPAHPQTAQQAQVAANADLNDRRQALSDLFAQIWEDHLRTSPEFASSIGDKRWNDQLSDYSVDAYNVQLARGREYLTKLAQIDTTGLSDQEILSADLMARQLVEQQEESQFKPWEMPVNQFSGLHLSLPQLVPRLSFTNEKDYDDYI